MLSSESEAGTKLRTMESRLREASKILKERLEEKVWVITHYDADGLCAGAIIHKSLLRENACVHTRSVKQLDEKVIKEIAQENPKIVVFTDLGSGQLDEIKKLQCTVVVLDHHQPKQVKHDIVHVNPHEYGIDGAREISGSGIAYLFSKALNPENIDMAALGVVGAVGDMQDIDGEMKGLNKDILEDGVNAGAVKVEKDLRLFGRQTRPLYKAIEYTTEPFIPGLSGSESSCIQFLNDLEIPIKKNDRFTMLADLTTEERQRLVTAVILRMIEHRIPPRIAESIVGDVYTLPYEKERTPLRDAREYATLLNGCGKHNKSGIGLAVCLGERGAIYEKSLEILRGHKRYLSSCYTWLSENPDRIKNAEVLYYLHANDEIDSNVIGTVSSMILNSRMLSPVKPIVAFSETEEGNIKVSSRATKELIESGINLGMAMLCASEKVGGEGGGHDIAAGAMIQKGKEEEFLRYLKEEIARQLNAKGSN